MLLQMQAWYDSTEMRKQAGKIKVEPLSPRSLLSILKVPSALKLGIVLGL